MGASSKISQKNVKIVAECKNIDAEFKELWHVRPIVHITNLIHAKPIFLMSGTLFFPITHKITKFGMRQLCVVP